MRFAVDTGGTFTDLVLEDGEGGLRLFKAPTTPADPVAGILDVLALAAADLGVDRAAMLAEGELFVHATTIAINAILTGRTARTAFLTTEGHPDILLFREGGRPDPFDFSTPCPEPYVPRRLTVEIPERIAADGRVLRPLDEGAARAAIAGLAAQQVEAVGVCLLWSIVNPAHEQRIGALIEELLPGVPYTLSHALNPILREYRRASSTCIDASLKPLMGRYLHGLERRLRAAGFGGRVLVVTSQGGVMEAADLAGQPVHAINSGPSMAPVAGRHYARLDAEAETAIVLDTGGTSFDVSLVRRGAIPRTREAWIGRPYLGHMTGFPSVDVRSIGAGGGSIAWVDEGGLLHVGPDSAGADPGPAAYGRGGRRATVTDAALALGYIDPDFFLGGSLPLRADLAARAVEADVAQPLGLPLHKAAAAILELATEQMVRAVEETTIGQGLDPAAATLVGGGGAAGLNIVPIARRLGCRRVVIPNVAAALSAAGALISDLGAEFARLHVASSAGFDRQGVNGVLAELGARCAAFAAGAGRGSPGCEITFSADARYRHQVWEIDLPLRAGRFDSPADVDALVTDFRAAHEDLFGFRDEASEVEFLVWRAQIRCPLRTGPIGRVTPGRAAPHRPATRPVFFPGAGLVEASVRRLEMLEPEERIAGPAILQSAVTTVVLWPGAVARRLPSGSLLLTP